MSNWTARAKAHFSEMGHPHTARTDETPLLAVSSVGAVALFENYALSASILEAAMRAADYWKDDPEEWRKQCMEVPPHQRADLLEHLQQQYRKH